MNKNNKCKKLFLKIPKEYLVAVIEGQTIQWPNTNNSEKYSTTTKNNINCSPMAKDTYPC